MSNRAGCFLIALSALALLAVAAPAASAPATVDVSLFAINDLHGNLKPPQGGITIADPSDPAKKIAVPAGGVEYMATLIHRLRAEHKNSIFVAAGDLIGASPLLSGLFHDEPTVESLNLMGLDVSSVGNHEFDHGVPELMRIQNGGCHPVDGCKGPHPFTGAKYRYLAANVIDKATGKPILPPYYVKTFDGIPVAFIGLVLKGTDQMVVPSGIAGVDFKDETDTVNALVPELRAKGIEAIVVLIHQGGFPTGGYNECPGIAGPIVDVVKKLDKAVDVVVSGHTHQAYNCVIDGRVVTSAHRYGTLVTEIDLKLDRKTHDVVSAKADNLIVRDDTYAKDPAQTQLIAGYETLAGPIEKRVVGTATDLLSHEQTASGETVLGDIIADAQLQAAKADGAQISFMNSGGVRRDIVKGDITFADLFAVQPFGNTLVTLDMTGAQIKDVLEQQWADPNFPRVMQVSDGFTYAWDATQPMGNHVVASSMILNGKPLDPAATYRVVVSNFLADGGDGMTVFKQGQHRTPGAGDVEATEAYLKAHNPIAPQAHNRVMRVK
ncbi:MAG TPA: bifunctional metallophosphatase/5'-nucleotidase [Rhizomicrobium sp.]